MRRAGPPDVPTLKEPGYERRAFASSWPTPRPRRMVLVDNPARLYGFS